MIKKSPINKNPFEKNIMRTDYKNINNKYNIKNNLKKESNHSNNSDIVETNIRSAKRKNDNYNISLNNKIHNNNIKPFNIKSEINTSFNKNYNQRKIIEHNTDKNYNSFSINKNYDKLILCRNTTLFIEKKENKKKSNIKKIKKEFNFQIVNYKHNVNSKKILINQIKNVNIENINIKKNLENFESKLELLRDKIRIKLGTYAKYNEKEKLLDKFGSMLIEKINKIHKSK